MEFQRLKLPNPRGVIDYNGKFVSANQQHQPIAHYSFREQSNTKNSFSLNFTREGKAKKKLNKSKSRSRAEENKNTDLKYRSADKIHQSYYEQPSKKDKSRSRKQIKRKKVEL